MIDSLEAEVRLLLIVWNVCPEKRNISLWLQHTAARKRCGAWLHSQKEHYRPQLNAYAQMVARTMKLPEENVEWTILFTSLPRLVWQGKRRIQ
jgi:hypothetical protein